MEGRFNLKKISIAFVVVVVTAIIGYYFGIQSDKGNDCSVISEMVDDTRTAVQEDSGEKGSLKQQDLCDGQVEVSGAVVTPGKYCMNEGDRIGDAISKAGGIRNEVFALKYVIQNLNLAQILKDQDKIYIPFQDDVVCQKASEVNNPAGVTVISNPANNIKSNISTTTKNYNDNSLKLIACININSATIEELDTLSGIGVSIAQKIIDGRPYNSINEITKVQGIGDALLGKIKDEICI